jgi:hypothetical protein
MDCDTDGRDAAQQVAASLTPVALGVEIADLAPGRADGYDLTNRIIERRQLMARTGRRLTSSAVLLAPDRSADHVSGARSAFWPSGSSR